METKDELLLSKLCEVSPISIEVIDIENRNLVCSNGWISQHLGYSEIEFDRLSNNMFEKIVHPEDRDKQTEAYSSLFIHPELPFKECTIRILKSDGAYIPVLLRIAILELDMEKKPKTFLCTVMDVNEIVLLQERLERELHKLDIISFKNSHELRGPVATILGLIQLIDHDGFDGAHAREIIACLKKAVVKLDAVIHEINTQTY